MQRKTTEFYLVDALSYTEAEARIIAEMTPLISGEFEISKVAKQRINEIFFEEDCDIFYKCKVNFITIDDKSGAEKITSSTMLVQANNINEAIVNLTKGMGGTLADYEIAAIAATNIIEYFPYVEQKG